LTPWFFSNANKKIEWDSFVNSPETERYYFPREIQYEHLVTKSTVIKPPICGNINQEFVDQVNKPIFENVLAVNQTTIISHLLIELKNYENPIDPSEFEEIYLNAPPGMGGVSVIAFPETTILPDTSRIEVWLNSNEFVRLDAEDSVRIYLPLFFPYEGTYSFSISLPLEGSFGKKYVFNSSMNEFSWIELNSVSNYQLIDAIMGDPLAWNSSCP
jgi:hypothetical protein